MKGLGYKVEWISTAVAVIAGRYFTGSSFM